MAPQGAIAAFCLPFSGLSAEQSSCSLQFSARTPGLALGLVEGSQQVVPIGTFVTFGDRGNPFPKIVEGPCHRGECCVVP